MTKEEILKKVLEFEKEGVESIKFYLDMGDETVDFLWDDIENNVRFEEIRIDEVVLTPEEAKAILTGKKHGIETTGWYGEVIKIHPFEGEPRVPETSKEAIAIGGFSNSNGIPERGELYVDIGLLEYTTEIEPTY